MGVKILSRTVDINGSLQVIQEDRFTRLAQYLKGQGSGETLEDCIERIIIETKEAKFDDVLKPNIMAKAKVKTPSPNTMDYYLTIER